MLNTSLYMLQRLTALIMAPLVLGHIAVMIYAVRGGLSSAEILSRTQGNFWWMLFYGTFVAAVSIHGAIGLRVAISETFKLKNAPLMIFTWGVFLVFAALGFRAVYAVTSIGSGL